MTPGNTGPDRLLPRHKLPFELEMEWNVARSRSLFGRETETSVRARLLDISLDGALIEVPTPTDQNPGKRVSIRLRGESGSAKIRHGRLSAAEDLMLYGIQFEMTEGLQRVVNELVDEIQALNSGSQGHSEDGGWLVAWERWEQSRRAQPEFSGDQPPADRGPSD